MRAEDALHSKPPNSFFDCIQSAPNTLIHQDLIGDIHLLKDKGAFITQLRQDREMAPGLRNRPGSSGSSSICSVEGSRLRAIHADSVFVGRYSPRMNSIKFLPPLKPSRPAPMKPSTPFFSLCVFSPSPKTDFDRWTTGRSRLKPGQWSGMRADKAASIFGSPNKPQKLVFILMASDACRVFRQALPSIARLCHCGQRCCASGEAMSCVSL